MLEKLVEAVHSFAPSVVIVAGFTVFITVTRDIPFWVPFGVLTLNFILADLICVLIQKRSSKHEDLELDRDHERPFRGARGGVTLPRSGSSPWGLLLVGIAP
jgi:hypothetical protein